jgi:aromatic-L-amino-acid decarboxylase
MHPDLEQLQQLESLSRQLDPDESIRQTLSATSFAYVNDFINSLPTRKAYIKAECPQLKNLSVTDEGKSIDELMNIINTEVHHAGINAASGGHLGYIPGGGLFLSSIGDMLAAVGNRYAGLAFSGKGSVIMENQLLQWMNELVGYPSTAHGNIASGGSIATLIALTTARDHHNINSVNVRKSVLYFTSQAHHCIQKAIHILGLSEAILHEVPVNDLNQMDTDALSQMVASDKANGLNPFVVIATAGTTNTGAIDPLDQVGDIAKENGLWYHIDAAYGGFFMLLEEQKEKFKGIEKSDSVVLDPHKGMFLPFGIGVVLVKDKYALLKAHHADAAYLLDTIGHDEINPADCGPELTKHFRGMRMWLPLHYHGLDAFRACLQEKLVLCQYFHEQIAKLGFETGPEPSLSVTYFRYPGKEKNEINKKLVEKLHEDGRIFFSSTILNGAVWIRCAILSFRTHLEQVELGLRIIKESLVALE